MSPPASVAYIVPGCRRISTSSPGLVTSSVTTVTTSPIHTAAYAATRGGVLDHHAAGDDAAADATACADVWRISPGRRPTRRITSLQASMQAVQLTHSS